MCTCTPWHKWLKALDAQQWPTITAGSELCGISPYAGLARPYTKLLKHLTPGELSQAVS